MNAAIAQHLNITEAAIIRVEEWAHVLFVVCKKLGARFVSKKVIKQMKFVESGMLHDRKLFVAEDGKHAIAQGEYPDSSFFNPLTWNQEANKWDWMDNGRSWATFEAAVKRITGEYKPQPTIGIVPPGYMVTSLGEIVLAEDWDEIERNL